MDVYSVDEWIDEAMITPDVLNGQFYESVYCWDYALNAAFNDKAVMPIYNFVQSVKEHFPTLKRAVLNIDQELSFSYFSIDENDEDMDAEA